MLSIQIGSLAQRIRPSLPKRHGRFLLCLGAVIQATQIAFVKGSGGGCLSGDFMEISLAIGFLPRIMREVG
jgi:hypothetical protein